MQKISAIILTKNEEQNIEKCIKSVSWCDEIIVIDDNSTDETVEISEKNSAKVYSRSLDNFSNQRNFGITKANGEWVFFVDADEIVSDALAYEISNAVGLKNQDLKNYYGFYIRRLDFMWKKKLKYGETGSIKLLRLAKKTAGEWKGKVHEEWEVKGNVGILKNLIIHYPHQTVAEFLEEINFYTNLRAKDLYSKRIKTNILSIILYPSGKFILNYFFKKGFLDRIPGLVHALLMSFHSFLVRSKLWIMWNEK